MMFLEEIWSSIDEVLSCCQRCEARRKRIKFCSFVDGAFRITGCKKLFLADVGCGGDRQCKVLVALGHIETVAACALQVSGSLSFLELSGRDTETLCS